MQKSRKIHPLHCFCIPASAFSQDADAPRHTPFRHRSDGLLRASDLTLLSAQPYPPFRPTLPSFPSVHRLQTPYRHPLHTAGIHKKGLRQPLPEEVKRSPAVSPWGVEPQSSEPESDILSIELRRLICLSIRQCHLIARKSNK